MAKQSGGGRYFPCGHTRREFVWQMGGGFAGLALASLLEGDGFFSRVARADQPARRGREAVANRTMVVRSRSSVTKKSSAVIPVAPPESPRAMTL